MLRSIWTYRAVAIAACAVGFSLYGFNEVVVGTIVILGGLLMGLVGAFVIAYLEAGKRGVVGIVVGGLAQFFGDFLSI
jgi:hypothetical protein